jgi:hypothetical protein
MFTCPNCNVGLVRTKVASLPDRERGVVGFLGNLFNGAGFLHDL